MMFELFCCSLFFTCFVRRVRVIVSVVVSILISTVVSLVSVVIGSIVFLGASCFLIINKRGGRKKRSGFNHLESNVSLNDVNKSKVNLIGSGSFDRL